MFLPASRTKHLIGSEISVLKFFCIYHRVEANSIFGHVVLKPSKTPITYIILNLSKKLFENHTAFYVGVLSNLIVTKS